MNTSNLRKQLDIITTILILSVFTTVAIIYLHGRLYPKQVDPAGSTINKDIKIADAFNIDYKTHSRTLILALSKDCVYCAKSSAFYKKLLSLQDTTTANTQILAAFSNDEWEAKQYLRKEGLESLAQVSNINFGHLKITALPTLLLIDRLGRVLESWSGQLDNEREQQVVEAVTNRTHSIRSGDQVMVASKTFDLFDVNKPTHAINFGSDVRVNIVDVDSQGYVYVQVGRYIEKQNVDGNILERIQIPKEMTTGVACAGEKGDFHFILSGKILTSHHNGQARLIKETPLPSPNGVLSAKYDQAGNNILILVNSIHPSNKTSDQTLYKLSVITGRLTEMHRASLPFIYNAAVGLGKISYAIGPNRLYVSDTSDYKIYVYSLSDNSLLNTFTEQFNRPSVKQYDGKLESRNLLVEDVSQGGLLTRYPAIFNLNYISSKNLLLVWTSVRNSSHNQLIDIYDSDFHHLGRDFKPTNPLLSDYHFVEDMVVVLDYGLGKEFHLDSLSPLEPPYYKPRSIKTFQLSDSPLGK